jgi:hypothetical protein
MGRGASKATLDIEDIARFGVADGMAELEQAEATALQKLGRDLLYYVEHTGLHNFYGVDFAQMLIKDWARLPALSKSANPDYQAILNAFIVKATSQHAGLNKFARTTLSLTRAEREVTLLGLKDNPQYPGNAHLRRNPTDRRPLCGKEFAAYDERIIEHVDSVLSYRPCSECQEIASKEPKDSELYRISINGSEGWSKRESAFSAWLTNFCSERLDDVLTKEEKPKSDYDLKEKLLARVGEGIKEGVAKEAAKKIMKLSPIERFNRLTFPYSNTSGSSFPEMRPLRKAILAHYGDPSEKSFPWPATKEMNRIYLEAINSLSRELTDPQWAPENEAKISAYLMASLFPEAVSDLNKTLDGLDLSRAWAEIWKTHFPHLYSEMPSQEKDSGLIA